MSKRSFTAVDLLSVPNPDAPAFRTAYDGLQSDFSTITGTDFSVPDDDADFHPSRSLTIQADAEDLDINNIMARYLKTGLVPSTRAQGFFGDASALPTFMEAQQVLIDAQMAFEALPAKVRDRFHNDPARFLEFLGDKDNESEARALGLLQPLPEASPPEGPKAAGGGEASPAPSAGHE